MTDEQIAQKYVGRVVSFEPDGPDGKLYLGTVLSCKPTEPLQPGNIPDFEMRIQGRSGKQLTVSMVENWVFVATDWKDALNREKEHNESISQ